MTAIDQHNTHIDVLSPTRWRIVTRGLTMDYSFDPARGLVLEQMSNTSGSREVQYCAAPESAIPFGHNGGWRLDSARIGPGVYGGRRVEKIEIILTSLNIKLTFHLVAFPGNAIIRQWWEAENTSFSRSVSLAIAPFRTVIQLDDYRDTYCCHWFTGGNSNYDQGLMQTQPLGKSSSVHLHSSATYHYVPLILLTRENPPFDGLMVEMDYCGVWNCDLKNTPDRLDLAFIIDDNKGIVLNPTETLELPVITLGVFCGDLDNLMQELYNWQYTYLWDYTNNDYYAKTRNIGNWVYNTRNLHEQFAYRLASFNLRGAQEAQACGYDIFWDDAGWSAYPGWPPDSYGAVFHNNYDGPDFRLSQRFFRKCGLHWLIWFAGKPAIGLLASKEAAWGSFEWRTDAFDVRDLAEEREIKQRIRTYLEGNPARSYHTCSGGSTYAHTFDIQRYANYNYLADGGAGPFLNYYYSYFETPDRWGDILLYLGDKLLRRDGGTALPASATGVIDTNPPRYSPEFARSRLAMVPMTGPSGEGVSPADKEAVRLDIEIYHYLIKMGVAGRWSYLFHPTVYGDKEHYYLQRTSHDAKRACILLLHRPQNRITVFPRGLQDDCEYLVSFQNDAGETARGGADLMANGILLPHVSNGELIYLNLPDHPGRKNDTRPPGMPGLVVCRIENNIGSTGVGIYWSPGLGDTRVSFYEVARDGLLIGQVGTGNYYFDCSKGWDIGSRYTVRTSAGSGMCSAWQAALAIRGESMQISALGGHHGEQGYNGWSAEVSDDLVSYRSMAWIAPANNPAADFGGTPNQPGGTEGYWQAAGARIGRGWYQAAADVHCRRTHTVIKSGRVRVVGRALKEWYHQNSGCDLRACILLNDQRVWPVEEWAWLKRCDLNGAQHDIILSVSKGDRLRFVVGRTGGEPSEDFPWSEDANLVGWIPCITYEEDAAAGEPITESTVRLNCGSSVEVSDSAGRVWQADRFYNGTSEVYVGGMDDDDRVLATARTGSDIVYRIPVTTGVYTLKLTFIEPFYTFSGERSMSLAINGEIVAHELDITAECRGVGIKLEKLYHGIVPDGDGIITIRLTGIKYEAIIQAIEVAPELRDHLMINCGSDQPFIDWAGGYWAPDTGFTGGTCIRAQAEPSQVTPTLYDRDLYMTARSGMRVDYRLAAGPGLYDVQLKFAELWYAESGQKPCDIYINHQLVKASWDAATAAGRKYMACDLRFEGIGPVDGYISISLRAAGLNPVFVQALEIE